MSCPGSADCALAPYHERSAAYRARDGSVSSRPASVVVLSQSPSGDLLRRMARSDELRSPALASFDFSSIAGRPIGYSLDSCGDGPCPECAGEAFSPLPLQAGNGLYRNWHRLFLK